MSEENVETVERWFAAMAKGDLREELWDADLIVDNTPEFPVTGPYRGYAGLRRWWTDLSEVIDGARIELDEATPLDGERVLSVQRLVGDMAHTRLPVNAGWSAIWIVRSGKLCRVSGYATRSDAIQAAGLSEQAVSEENVDRLAAMQRGTEAFNRRDAEGMIEELDAEIEWTDALLQVLLGGEEQTYHGHEGVRDLIRKQDELFSEFSTEYSEVRQRGDKMLAVGNWRTRGRSSGVPMETPVATLIEFKGVKAIRIRTYLDPDEGLEAAGLSE